MSIISKKILRNHEKFENRIEAIIRYGLDTIRNTDVKKNKEEKSILLEALILRSCALWESFVENEIILLVSLDPKKIIEKMELSEQIKIDLTLIRALIFMDEYRNYYDIERSEGELKKIISDKYNLFKIIKGEKIKKLRFIYKLRNYLSHYSAFSKKQFTVYEKSYGYKRFQEPVVFLSKKEGKHFEELIHNFKLISVSMKTKLKGDFYGKDNQ